jgi:hypothetical protein
MRSLLLLAALGATAFAQQPQTPPAIQPAAISPASQSPPAAAQNPISPQIPATPIPPSQAPSATPAATTPPLSPTEAYLYAMQPFTNARSAPDDLTDSDKWALGIGIARAKEQCELPSKDQFEGEDLLAMGKLCVFGQDYEPARHRLIVYTGLPNPKALEVGELLLARAFVGLGSIDSAEGEMETLLTSFPYDASIHLGIDMVIDAAAASDSTDDLAVIPRLNEQQLPHILDALAHGASLTGNGDSVDAAMLVRDALRCADALRRNYKPDEADKIVAQVTAAAAAEPIVSSAAYPVIQESLIRYKLYAQPSPVRTLHATEFPLNAAPRNRVVPLYDPNPAAHRIVRGSGSHTIIRMTDDRTLVLVFSLAGPASSPAIQQIFAVLTHDHVLPGLKVVAVTSWAANIGVEKPDPTVLATIRAFRTGLPPTLPVLLIPDSELKPFAIDMWPAAILIDGKGRILWLNTLSGSTGSIRQMTREMESAPVLPF